MKALFKAGVVSTDTNYAHRIHVGHFDLVTDEPAALGGQGTGPAPYDYYLASLASCTATHSGQRSTRLATLRFRLLVRCVPGV